MDKEELKALCNDIAERRFSEIRTDHRVYQKTVKILFKFLDDHNILPVQGALSLSEAEVRKLTISLKLRKKANRPMGKCLVDILSQLKNSNLYKGGFPNLPNQVERMLAVNPAVIPWSDYGEFLMLKEAVVQPLDRTAKMTLDETGRAYFSEFLASSYIDGALWDDFHREVIHVTFDDVTFSPLSISLPLSRTDIDDEEWRDKRAFFRYWLSPRTEMYFLRLILFWKKHERELGLNFDGFHVFPSEWRRKEDITLIPKRFERWTSDIFSKRKAQKNSFGIRAFRQLCIIDLLPSVPPFVMSALSGVVLCDSFRLNSISLVDSTLRETVQFKGSRPVHDEPGRTDGDREIEKMLEKGQGLLNSDEDFLKVTAGLRNILSDLPRRAPRSERMAAAKKVEVLIPELSSEESGNSKKFLLNVIFFGRWLIFMLKETKYDKATIEIRISMIFGKFIFMLGNNAIHELNTDALVDIIAKTYTFYDSASIRKDIREFTDHLFLYQESIYPEMKWEALPWGRGDVLYKENILRTKPFISFKNVRDALEKINKNYSGIMAKRLRAAIILGFYAGLRIVEVAYLKASSFMLDGSYSLAIRDSKTKSGIRNINLSLLLPPEERKEVLALFKQEGHYALTIDKYVFADEEPEEARRSIPIDVAKIFKSVGVTVRFHHLRHSFANWFILRYWYTIYGKEAFPEGTPFLHEDLFNEKNIANFRRLFFGFGPKKIWHELFTYAILVLARIMGHYGPITTMNSYLHIIDWIFRLSVVKKWSDMTFDLKSSTVQDLMQLSYPALPASLKKRSLEGIAASDIIKEQLSALKRDRKIKVLFQ